MSWRPTRDISARSRRHGEGSLGHRSAVSEHGDGLMKKASLVRVVALAKRYDDVPAVHPLDLEFDEGDFLAILGPSGCGKTTLLKMLGGFVRPSEGRIVINHQDVTDLPPEKRPTNMVFQGYGLFPHMSVKQ